MNLYFIISSQDVKLSTQHEAALRAIGNLKVIVHKGKISDIQELVSDEADKVIALDPDVTDWSLDPAELGTIKNLKAICTQSTAFTWLSPEELKKKGIAVYNVPGFSTDSVAEYAIAMAIESARRLPLHLKAGSLVWATQPMLLKGKTLGIVGLGKIGKRIAEIGKGFGMEVVYWSKNSRDDRFTLGSLEEVFSRVDVLIPALKDMKDGQRIITNDLLNRLKETAVVVRIVGGLIDHEHVISRVEAGKLGGYAFEGEDAKDLNTKGNIWGVPAMAWYTKDSLESLLNGWVKNVIEAAKGGEVNRV